MLHMGCAWVGLRIYPNSIYSISGTTVYIHEYLHKLVELVSYYQKKFNNCTSRTMVGRSPRVSLGEWSVTGVVAVAESAAICPEGKVNERRQQWEGGRILLNRRARETNNEKKTSPGLEKGINRC